VTKFLLSLHVIAAIVAIGPITVATGMFPRAARAALAAPGEPHALAVVLTLRRICRVYGAVGVAVPVLGVATALSTGVLGDTWLSVSLALTAAAALVLLFAVLPVQEEVVAGLGAAPPERITARIRAFGMTAGVFNLLWATVTVLMIVRPGSTTGA
jgi:hypothetical protein